MKTAIVQCGPAETGKSTTVRMIYEALVSAYPKAKVETIHLGVKEVIAVVTIGTDSVGFLSYGDPSSPKIRVHLKEFADAGCVAIVCSCRTRGDTYDAVSELEGRGYRMDWRPRKAAPTDAKNLVERDHAIATIRKLIG